MNFGSIFKVFERKFLALVFFSSFSYTALGFYNIEIDPHKNQNAYFLELLTEALEDIHDIVPTKIKDKIQGVRLKAYISKEGFDQNITIPSSKFKEQIFIDLLYFEQIKDLVIKKFDKEKISLDLSPLRNLERGQAIFHLKAFLIYGFTRCYIKNLSTKERGGISRSFGHYPIEFYHKPAKKWGQQSYNWKRFFASQVVSFLLAKDYHSNSYPYSHYLLSRTFDLDYPEFTFNTFQVNLKPELNSEEALLIPEPDYQLKDLLFNKEKHTLDQSYRKIFAKEETVSIPVRNILGISMLLAGDEGSFSTALGHTGLVIFVCDRDRYDVKSCLKNSGQHIAFNPVGDTSFFEHNIIKKVIAGTISGGFPMIYHTQRLEQYTHTSNQVDKRDIFISPPIVTQDDPLSLALVLAKIQEFNLHTLTKGYSFFTESCVHTSKHILSSFEEDFLLEPLGHSYHQQLRIFPRTPISLWRFFEDQFFMNPKDTELNQHLAPLWASYGKFLNRKYHFMFKGSQKKSAEESKNHLEDSGLVWLGLNDGLSRWQRDAIEKQAKRISEIAPTLSLCEHFSKDILTVKEYASIHPIKKLHAVKGCIAAQHDKEAAKSVLYGFIELETHTFMRLDDFFERSKIFNEEIARFIKNDYFPFKFYKTSDLRFHRKIGEKLTPFNMYAYLVYQEKGIQRLNAFMSKYYCSSINTEFCDPAHADEDTLLMIKNFYKISDQIHDAINNGEQKKKGSFARKLFKFWHQWRWEWELSKNLLKAISATFNEFSNVDSALANMDNAISQYEGYYDEMEQSYRSLPKRKTLGIGFKHLQDNLSKSEAKTKSKRLASWL